jgi:hypothetical protein
VITPVGWAESCEAVVLAKNAILTSATAIAQKMRIRMIGKTHLRAMPTLPP